jgi:hypothetical protein
LASYGNSSLWGNLLVDGDGLRSRVIAGSFCIAHNSSYMAKELTALSSVGIVIYCRASQCWLKASVAEESDSTSNYCGKLLGAVLALPILQAAGADLAAPSPVVILHFNNRGVLLHGNNPLLLLLQKQK